MRRIIGALLLIIILSGCAGFSDLWSGTDGESAIPTLWYQHMRDHAPDNPTDLTGWLLAALGATGIGGAEMGRRYIRNKRRRNGANQAPGNTPQTP